MIKVWTSTLSQLDYDKRDFLVGNVVKNLDKIAPAEQFMRGISETYQQWKLGSCTAMATTHSMKIQNELEYNSKIFLDWKFLRAKMWHSITVYDGWDSVDNAIKTALKNGIDWLLDWKVVNFKADCYAYWLRDNRMKALQPFPLITVIKWNANTRKEMILWEVKTVWKFRDWHAVLIAWYDKNYVYFYNSFGDAVTKNGISNFKISRPNFDAMIKNGMINWRYFTLIDKKELKDYAVEIEVSKQIIWPAKKLYEIWDKETKEYFEKIWLTKYLEWKYGFKY